MNRHSEDRMRQHGGRRRAAAAAAVTIAIALVAGACTGNGTSGNASPRPATGASQGTTPKAIPQPAAVDNLPLAADSERVDLALPSFSNPTNITNPLFPVSKQESVLFLGRVDGKPFRTEVTLLPITRIIEWQGLQVKTLVIQYNAFLDGRITEIAYDYYAQADDGSVWYFGEDVFDFRDGVIIVTEGTWLAGRDGPAAMIMPGDPQVGAVYRSENAPGFVFEQVTVASVGRTLEGPLGPINGGMLADELHRDGKVEQKIFAPGYGEFLTGGGGDVEALALAVPTDAASEPMPTELTTMSSGALAVFDAAGSGDWKTASARVKEAAAAWESRRAGAVPRLIEPRLSRALEVLAQGVRARRVALARTAAIEAARLSFDLQLRYRPPAEIDLARLDLWAAQTMVDAAAKDAAGVGADAFALDYVRDRILRALSDADLTKINLELGAIQVAVVDEDLAAATDAAKRLRDVLAGLKLAN